MKRLLFIGALSGAGAKEAHSQTIATMTAQLNELQVFNRSMVSGYHLMSEGLDSIGTIDEKEYLLHVNYFQSLSEIDRSIGVNQEKIATLNKLLLQIKALLYDEVDETAAPARYSRRLALPH